MKHYTADFYADNYNKTADSASEIVPFLVNTFSVRSILDVGCGNGLWLKNFLAQGVSDIIGVDGEYVNEEILQIPKPQFRAFDLHKPLNLGRNFDLVISLEVAEHLSEDSADIFVNSLCNHGNIIVFSASIPLQGGVDHVNEQWQSYWSAKFEENGYLPIDIIRPYFWDNPKVAEYYAQNMICYYNSRDVSTVNIVTPLYSQVVLPINIVHPRQYEIKADPHNQSIPTFVKYLPSIIVRVIKNRFYRRV